MAEFHTELELFAHPDLNVLENVYIKHAVSMEQYLMEGRYNKVSVQLVIHFRSQNISP